MSPIDQIRSGAAQRARTTAVGIVAAAQNGTSVALNPAQTGGNRLPES
jgi:hypothetical protein